MAMLERAEQLYKGNTIEMDAYKQGYEDAVEVACEWLKNNIYDYIAVGNTDFGKPYDIDLCADELLNDFRTFMFNHTNSVK